MFLEEKGHISYCACYWRQRYFKTNKLNCFICLEILIFLNFELYVRFVINYCYGFYMTPFCFKRFLTLAAWKNNMVWQVSLFENLKVKANNRAGDWEMKYFILIPRIYKTLTPGALRKWLNKVSKFALNKNKFVNTSKSHINISQSYKVKYFYIITPYTPIGEDGIMTKFVTSKNTALWPTLANRLRIL